MEMLKTRDWLAMAFIGLLFYGVCWCEPVYVEGLITDADTGTDRGSLLAPITGVRPRYFSIVVEVPAGRATMNLTRDKWLTLTGQQDCYLTFKERSVHSGKEGIKQVTLKRVLWWYSLAE